jgi:arsenate reductase
MTAHWGIEDPAVVEGSDAQRTAAFSQAARFLKNRITAFINLPLASVERMSLQHQVRRIGEMDGSSSKREKA